MPFAGHIMLSDFSLCGIIKVGFLWLGLWWCMREKQEKIDYIFLDVDGVLNTKNQWKRMFTLDGNCIKRFSDYAKAVSQGTPKVILTSTWKNGYSNDGKHSEPVMRLINSLRKHGVRVAGRTGSDPSGDRAREINDYIEKNQLHDCRMLVVDDDASIFRSELKENVRFVGCDSRMGFAKGIPETNGADSWARKLKRFFGVGLTK